MRDPVLGNVDINSLEAVKDIQQQLALIMNSATVVLNIIVSNGWSDGTARKHTQNILDRAKSDSKRIARVIKKVESNNA